MAGRRDAALGDHGRAGLCLQPCRKRRVIAVSVGDKDVAHRPAGDGADQRAPMRPVLWAWIDHCKRIASDDIAVGAVKGQRPGIGGCYPQNAARNRYGLAMGGFKNAVENRFAHLDLPRADGGKNHHSLRFACSIRRFGSHGGLIAAFWRLL